LEVKPGYYTSTPPMGRTACTEPQCLYKGDLYLTLLRFVDYKLLGTKDDSSQSQGCKCQLFQGR